MRLLIWSCINMKFPSLSRLKNVWAPARLVTSPGMYQARRWGSISMHCKSLKERFPSAGHSCQGSTGYQWCEHKGDTALEPAPLLKKITREDWGICGNEIHISHWPPKDIFCLEQERLVIPWSIVCHCWIGGKRYAIKDDVLESLILEFGTRDIHNGLKIIWHL